MLRLKSSIVAAGVVVVAAAVVVVAAAVAADVVAVVVHVPALSSRVGWQQQGWQPLCPAGTARQSGWSSG